MAEEQARIDDIERLPVERLTFLTDGLFAIVMTLTVLALDVPEIPSAQVASELPEAVWDQWPIFMSYVITFLVLGFYWVAHHAMYRYILYLDRPLIWLNLICLMFIAVLPFTTELHGDYPGDFFTILVYGGNLMLISLLFSAQWSYVGRHEGQLDPRADALYRRRVGNRSLVTTASFGLGILLALINPYLAVPMWSLTPLWQGLLRRLDARRPSSGEPPRHAGL